MDGGEGGEWNVDELAVGGVYEPKLDAADERNGSERKLGGV
jgi:hypothetical protein